MDRSLTVIWPTEEAYAGLEPGEALRIADLPSGLADRGLSLTLSLPRSLCPEQEITFDLSHIRDFRPERLVRKSPYLANILEASEAIAAAQSRGTAIEDITQRLQAWPGLPLDTQSISVDGPAKPPSGSSRALDRILDLVAAPEGSTPPSQSLNGIKSTLDRHIGNVLSRVYQDPLFRRLESLWRSIHLLLKQAAPDASPKCTVLPVEPSALEESLDAALPRLVEDLPSLLLVDVPLDSSAHSLRLLEKIAALGETLLIPAVCWLSPAFFHLGSFEEMDRLPYLPHHLEAPEYAKWRRLIGSPAADWLAVTCNRFVLRAPLPAPESQALPGLKEEEPLWGSPVWALASLLERSRSRFGWPTHFSDWRQVRLENMDTVPGSKGQGRATETVFTDERLHQLSRCHICPVMGAVNQDLVFAPLDSTLSGKPLSGQVFASTMSQELIAAREAYAGPLEASAIKDHLVRHFDGVFERHGQTKPESLQVSTEETISGWRTRLSVLPSQAMLPAPQELAMDLDWL